MQRVGVLGLPQSGKSTLFQILLQGAGAAPTGGREAIGIVEVPDERLDRLSALYKPKKTTRARIQFVESGAAGQSARAGKSDLFAGVRDCDALLVVVRDFENPAVPSVNGVDPERDWRAIETELILNDLALVETRIERIAKDLRVGKRENEREHAALEKAKAALDAEQPLRALELDPEATKLLRGFQFLSRKPVVVVYNQDEGAKRAPSIRGPALASVALAAELERQIVALPPEERPAYRAELGLTEDGLSLVIRACYDLLGLIAFFTVGPDEVRAWTIRRGEKAVEAAGEIHSDLARGFIRAEVIEWDALLEAGGTAGARTRGKLRLEGKTYEVQDGDCMEIRFNA